MVFILSKSVKKGQVIKTSQGWYKVKSIENNGVMVKDGLIRFGELIYGWKKN